MALKRGILDYFTEIAENVCGFINKYRRIPAKCNKILGKFREILGEPLYKFFEKMTLKPQNLLRGLRRNSPKTGQIFTKNREIGITLAPLKGHSQIILTYVIKN